MRMFAKKTELESINSVNEKKMAMRQLALKGTCLAAVANSAFLSFADSADTGDGGLFDAMNSSTDTLLQSITNFLDTSVLPWVLLAVLISLGLAGGNERVLPTIKSAIKFIVIAFVGINVINLIVNTILWIATTINSG